MGKQPSEPEVFEPSFPSLEEQAQYVGKVVAFDSGGKIRAAGDSWAELLAKLTDEMLESLTLLDIPGVRFIA